MSRLQVQESEASSNHSHQQGSRNKYILWGVMVGFFFSSMMSTTYSVPNISSTVSITQKISSEDFVGSGDNDNVGRENDRKEEEEATRLETAVIMVTGLLPSHPSIW
eukprot:6079196-Ditylum_brightwellii.AAC.1